MKLEAKQRLLAEISADERARLFSAVDPLMKTVPNIKWWAVRDIDRGPYPQLGTISTKSSGYNGDLTVSVSSPDLSKVLTLDIAINIEVSNEVHRGNARSKQLALTVLKEAAAVLKKIGKVTEEPARGNSSLPRLSLAIPIKKLGNPAADPKSKSPQGAGKKYGIQVIDTDGKPHVFTMTSNSMGPWSSADEAQSHIPDLRNHLEYDDDFKRANSFKVVEVKP